MIYRPLGCPKEKFSDKIVKIDEWIKSIDNTHQNKYMILNRDLSFPLGAILK